MKKMSESDDYFRRTLVDFVRDARRDGLKETLEDGGM